MSGAAFWALAKRFWWAVPILVLVAMLYAARADRDDALHERDHFRDLSSRLSERLSITTEALNGALGQIDRNNARIREDAARLKRAEESAAANQAKAAERWKGTEALIEELRASAVAPNRAPCTLSPAARRALEDL